MVWERAVKVSTASLSNTNDNQVSWVAITVLTFGLSNKEQRVKV